MIHEGLHAQAFGVDYRDEEKVVDLVSSIKVTLVRLTLLSLISRLMCASPSLKLRPECIGKFWK